MPLKVARRRGQPDDLRRHRGAGLEPLRRRGVGGGLHGHRLDHRAAGEKRRQRVEQLAAAVEHTDSVGAQHLVPGECGEVDVEGVEVDRLVRHRLAGVQHRQGADGLRPLDQLGDRGHRAGDVRVMAERNDFDVLVELQRIQIDASVVGHAVPAQRGAGTPGQFLPRDEVGVVLELGGDDDVARPDGTVEAVVPQHIRHQVERFGGVLGEHQLIGIGTDERGDVGSALLVSVGGLLHQLVRAAVHRAIGGGEEFTLGVEDLQRTLRRRTGIQVRQLVSAPHHASQDREVGPDRREIQRRGTSGRDRHVRPPRRPSG